MKKPFLVLGLSILSSFFYGINIEQALDELKENPYGFVFCDMGISADLLEKFKSLDIQKEWVYHQFGELENSQDSLTHFLTEIGFNDQFLCSVLSHDVHEITSKVISASGKETGWVCLRSFVPVDRYDIPRWHVDGPYYVGETPNDIIFKLVITLVGPTTIFYPLPLKSRRMTENLVHNRLFMKNFCKEESIVSPKLGEGAVFRAGLYTSAAALHSEPPIHTNRLFLSIVPCNLNRLESLKKRVLLFYPPHSKK